MDRNSSSYSTSLMPLEVALRKESVDRNSSTIIYIMVFVNVALRKESVDRNRWNSTERPVESRRSPQGERG